MAKLKAFKGYRPTNDKVKQVASRPYDVLNSSEAREEAKDNIYSLLRIIKPEIGLTPGVDLYTKEVYDKAKSNFDFFKENGWLVQDEEEYLYIYAQTMFGKTQYGIVGCASVDDYMNNVIKKHELTRPDKEEDRMKHVRVTNANMEPVFFSYTAVDEIDSIVGAFVKENNPVFDFTADDGVGHHFWVIKDKHIIKSIIDLFEKLPATYVADGHHRTAAAALVGNEKKRNNPEHTGEESYNYFLAVHFPDNQLTIIDYNRVVKDLSGYSKDEFMDKLKLSFDIEEIGSEVYKPNKLHEFSMYIEGRWYKLTAKPGTYDDSDPIGILDVTILTNQVLKPLLDGSRKRRSCL